MRKNQPNTGNNKERQGLPIGHDSDSLERSRKIRGRNTPGIDEVLDFLLLSEICRVRQGTLKPTKEVLSEKVYQEERALHFDLWLLNNSR